MQPPLFAYWRRIHACSAYRGLYILNWIYKAMTEDNYRQWIGEIVTVILCPAFMTRLWCKTYCKVVTCPTLQWWHNVWCSLFCMQCGFQELSRRLCMQTFSTTISEVGRIMKSFLYLLKLCPYSLPTMHLGMHLRAPYLCHMLRCSHTPHDCWFPNVWSLVNAEFGFPAAANACCRLCAYCCWYML